MKKNFLFMCFTFILSFTTQVDSGILNSPENDPPPAIEVNGGGGATGGGGYTINYPYELF